VYFLGCSVLLQLAVRSTSRRRSCYYFRRRRFVPRGVETISNSSLRTFVCTWSEKSN